MPLRNKQAARKRDASAVANPGPQDEQELKGALRCQVFPKPSASTQPGRRGTAMQTQLAFRTGIEAGCPDQPQPSWYGLGSTALSWPHGDQQAGFHQEPSAGRMPGRGGSEKPDPSAPPRGRRPGFSLSFPMPSTPATGSSLVLTHIIKLLNADGRRGAKCLHVPSH